MCQISFQVLGHIGEQDRKNLSSHRAYILEDKETSSILSINKKSRTYQLAIFAVHRTKWGDVIVTGWLFQKRWSWKAPLRI